MTYAMHLASSAVPVFKTVPFIVVCLINLSKTVSFITTCLSIRRGAVPEVPGAPARARLAKRLPDDAGRPLRPCVIDLY